MASSAQCRLIATKKGLISKRNNDPSIATTNNNSPSGASGGGSGSSSRRSSKSGSVTSGSGGGGQRGQNTNTMSFTDVNGGIIRAHIQIQRKNCALVHKGAIRYQTTHENCVFSNMLPSICAEHLHYTFGLADSYYSAYSHGTEHEEIQVYSIQASAPFKFITECNIPLFKKNDIILPVDVFWEKIKLVDELKRNDLSKSIEVKIDEVDYKLSQPLSKFIRILVQAVADLESSFKSVDLGLLRNNFSDLGSSNFDLITGNESGGLGNDVFSCLDKTMLTAINNIVAYLANYLPQAKMSEFISDDNASNRAKHLVDVFTYTNIRQINQVYENPKILEELAEIAKPWMNANEIQDMSGILRNVIRALSMEYKIGENVYNRNIANVEFVKDVGIVAIGDIYDGDMLHLKQANQVEWDVFRKLKVYSPQNTYNKSSPFINYTIDGQEMRCKRKLEYAEFDPDKRKCATALDNRPIYPGLSKEKHERVSQYNNTATCLPSIGWNKN
jgi:hypothetical protein